MPVCVRHAVITLIAILCASAVGQTQPAGEGGGENGQRGRLLAQMTAFKTDVPQQDVNVILARPTNHSMTVSLAAQVKADAVVDYWAEGAEKVTRSEPVALTAGDVGLIELTGLVPGTEYHYRVGLVRESAAALAWGDVCRFRTQPAPGAPFSFAIQADSHLDQAVDPRVYEQTLKNMLMTPKGTPRPDFMIDLGDTFMTDKRGREFTTSLAQYEAQRYYFGLVAHSAPLFMVLGNHDGEKGTSGRDASDIGPWSYVQRTSRFPAPFIEDTPGAMYTGATAMKDGVGANYYAFEWGDAMFIMLDPYWSTTERVRGGGGGNRGSGRERGWGGGGEDAGEARPADEPLKPTDESWSMTLGRSQYDWLTRTLENADGKPGVKYRFLFIHHLVGGVGGAESRGGVESSHFFEWGGRNADGSPGFAEHRPGWACPIHDLLVKHKVSAVFHGHDHLFVRNERDGVVYQCVPQPGNPRGNTRTAAHYGYASGTIHASPGHVRVSVGNNETVVEFIATAIDTLDDARLRDRHAVTNGAVIHTHTIKPINQN